MGITWVHALMCTAKLVNLNDVIGATERESERESEREKREGEGEGEGERNIIV